MDLRLKVLSDQEVAKIHRATLHVLAVTGVEIRLPQAVAMLKNAGAVVKGETRVCIPAEMVAAALASAPKAQIIYNRNGQEAMILEGDHTHYGTGPTTPLVVVLVLFILGGGVIHDFAFSMLVGVVVGTYSSIFVASPVLLVWEGRFSGAAGKNAVAKT